jgi:predicted transcriptional regulator
MVSFTIQLSDATLERAKVLAESAGRSLDDVMQELTSEAVEHRTRVLEGLKQGLSDREVGRVVDVAHVNARLDEAAKCFDPPTET